MNEVRVRTWTVGLGFLLIGTLGAYVLGHLAANVLLLPARLTRADVRHAPNFVGSALEDARERAGEMGVGLDVLGLAYADDVDSGKVLFQYPPKGLPLEEGKPIEVLVSAGPGARRVPDVTSLPESSALALLKTAGIPVRRVQVVVEEAFEKGAVVSTDPPAGSSIGAEDSLVLAISRGGGIVEVPNLIGRSLKEAATILEGAQLRVGETTFAEGEEGTPGEMSIVAQDPPAGGLARSGTVVELRLGKAPSGVEEAPSGGVEEAPSEGVEGE